MKASRDAGITLFQASRYGFQLLRAGTLSRNVDLVGGASEGTPDTNRQGRTVPT